MKPQKIRALLIENKITQTSIALELKVSHTAVNRVIDRQFTSKRIREAIAGKLNIPFEKMWDKAA